MEKKYFLLVILFNFAVCNAQDFGYEYLMLTEYRALGVSYNVQQFKSASLNSLSDSNRIGFSTPLPFIEFRQNNGRLAVGYQTYNDKNGKSRESFSVYGESQNDFALGESKNSKALFYLPIIVSANYVRAQSQKAALEDFDIGSFGLGTGIKFKHFERSFGMQAFAIGSLYYASEGFSTDYGSQTSLCGEVQFVFSDILYQGILVGYRFESQRWNMNNHELNYHRQYHGAFIGFMF